MENAEFAAKDRSEITIETGTIEDLYREVMDRRPTMLHPNSDRVSQRPWGALEFGVLDKTSICVVFKQW